MDPYSRIPPTAEPLKFEAMGLEVSPYLFNDSEKIIPEKNNG
jgi:hypothetical protein